MNPWPLQRREGLLACLVFLPVLLLAGVGVYSLQQDRALARLEARDRAQRFADELRDTLASALTDPDFARSHHAAVFEVDPQGDLSLPPSYPAVPLPTAPPVDTLNEDQRRLWRSLMDDPVSTSLEGEEMTSALRAFLDSQPPASMAAMAHYRAGLWHAGRGNTRTAMELFEEFPRRHAGATGDSGLPLAPLAALRGLEWQRRSGDSPSLPRLESLCSNAVWHPSILTPHLLAAARRAARGEETNAVTRWHYTWADHELSRHLHGAIRAGRPPQGIPPAPGVPPTPLMFWVQVAREIQGSLPPPLPVAERGMRSVRLADDRPARLSLRVSLGGDQDWLAVRIAEPEGGATYHCWSAHQLARWLESPPAPSLPRMSLVVTLPAGQPPPDVPAANPASPGIPSVLGRMPSYLGVTLDVAGRRFGPTRWGSDGEAPVLASAVSGQSQAGILAVRVHLLDPGQLFARQRARTLWFGTLIGLSVATSGIGFLALWRAWRKQERLADMKTNFVSSVSHELRAPIASVRLLAEGLEQGEVKEPARRQEYYRFIVQECRRLSAMVENVLDISRIEQDRKDYELEPADVLALTVATVRRMEPNAMDAGVRLVFETTDGTRQHAPPDCTAWNANVDAAALQQALVNLIDNAIKHSPRDGRVTVQLARSPDHASLRWSVLDQGPGIPPGERRRVFERFYRIGSELHRNTQGVGIGLNIVQHVAQAHHGRVWVEDGEERGARFLLEIPVTTQREEE